MAQLYPSRIADQFVVRFPDGMRDRIRESAEANGRSMNAEIVQRLEQSFKSPGVMNTDELLAALCERLRMTGAKITVTVEPECGGNTTTREELNR